MNDIHGEPIREPNPAPGARAFYGDWPVKLHFCVGCGKVSRAQRKPKFHQRLLRGTVADGSEFDPGDMTGEEHARAQGFQVLEVHNAFDPADPDLDYEPPSATIACGPFRTWTATPDEPNDELEPDDG